jgi:hypothetical protein
MNNTQTSDKPRVASGLIETEPADGSENEAKLQVVVRAEHILRIVPTAKMVVCVSTPLGMVVDREWSEL